MDLTELIRMRRPAIAVVDLQGAIGQAIKPLDTSRLIGRLREDASVQAVVLNIDSPGGSAMGSDLIARSISRLREKKQVVAFIGGLGASGGYMLAAEAHWIVALPASLIGAIGVISYRPMVADALERVGVQMRVAKSGRLKDMLSPFREATEEERGKEQRIIDSLHTLFVEGVAKGRSLPIERVRELATGEVYAASDALSAGLVDKLGDIEDAIDWAAERAGVPRTTRIVKPRRSLRDLALGRASITLAEVIGAELDARASRGPQARYDGRLP